SLDSVVYPTRRSSDLGQVAFDDLLGRADGQRGLRGEVLQRGAAAVDRGVVEVGPELVPGFLGVLAHERLAAEAHIGLVGLAVARSEEHTSELQSREKH